MEKQEFKEKLKLWLKDPYSLALSGILLIAFIVRLYFFIQHSGQPLWWDEAEYMANAKHWGLGTPYEVGQLRPPLFQLIGAFFLKLGIGEIGLKFLLVLLPSVFIVYATYLLGRELFDKRVALIASAASIFVWSYLFWSIRFQPDFFTIGLQLIAFFFFWKLFKEQKTSYAVLGGLFASLSFYIKISSFLVPLVILAFVIFKDGVKFIRNKQYWIATGTFVASMIPFMVWQYVMFGSPLAFASAYSAGAGIIYNWGFGWMTLSFYLGFAKWLFFALFILGLLLVLFKTLLGFDLLIKEKDRRLDGKIFSIIALAVITLFYVFYIRGSIEDRWVFLLIPFIFYFSGEGLMWLYEKIKPFGRYFGIALIILCLGFFAYAQLQHSSFLIENKANSYLPVKEAGLFIKGISNPGDKIVTRSFPQMASYAEREIIWLGDSEENFTKLLKDEKPRYFVVSIFEVHPSWAFQQARTQEGGTVFLIPYLNSSLVTSPQGQLVQMDIKQTVEKEEVTFNFIYPTNQINGLFAYELTYKED